MEQNAKVALSILDPDNPYAHIAIRGTVARVTEEGADEHIDALAQKYLGQAKYPFRQPNEKRVIYEIEPVSAAGEREGRFRSVFGRQLAHRSGGDVRRIRKNQVIAAIGEIVEQVGLYEIDTPLQPIVREVALRDLECRA